MRLTRVLTAAALCSPPAFLLLSPRRAPPAALAQETAPPLTFDQIFDRAQAGALPQSLTWSPDGGRLAYLWDDGDGTALWVVTPGGEPHKVLARLDTAAPKEGSEAAAEDGRKGLGVGTESRGRRMARACC